MNRLLYFVLVIEIAVTGLAMFEQHMNGCLFVLPIVDFAQIPPPEYRFWCQGPVGVVPTLGPIVILLTADLLALRALIRRTH